MMSKKTKKIYSVDEICIKVGAILQDLKYSCVEYTYDRTDCTGECRANNDYCRCTKIINAKVTEVRFDEILEKIFKIISKLRPQSELSLYAIDRLVRRCGLENCENYDVSVCNGYYGQEINVVGLDQSVINQFVGKLRDLLNLKDNDKIYYVLKNEYSYILQSIKNKTWKVVEVDTDTINALQEDHYRRLDSEVVESYKDYDLPVCICVEHKLSTGSSHFGGYRLIDGYHRLCAKQDKKRVKIILGK